MDETLLAIRTFEGAGYRPLIDFGGWRMAMLRYLDDLQPDHIRTMERHIETDEVFVLLRGRGVLIIGGRGTQVDQISSQPMENGILYDIKRLVWHTILLSREASVLVVENRDTGRHNSEHAGLSEEQQGRIREIARNESMT